MADQLERLPAEATGLLGGRLDLDRLGAFGHSFGGNAALQWCRDDRRCRAAANLDGALWTEVGRSGLDRPALQRLLPLPAEGPVRAMLAATAIDPRRMWRVTCDVLLAFFATHLDQEPAPPLLKVPQMTTRSCVTARLDASVGGAVPVPGRGGLRRRPGARRR